MTEVNKIFLLRVAVLEGRNWYLDRNKTPTDPIVFIELQILDDSSGSKKQKRDTEIIRDTPNPKWNQEFDFKLLEKELETTVVTFEAWGTRGVGRSFLGQVSLPISELPRNSSWRNAQEEWYELDGGTDRTVPIRHIKLKIGLLDSGEVSIEPPTTSEETTSRQDSSLMANDNKKQDNFLPLNSQEVWNVVDETDSSVYMTPYQPEVTLEEGAAQQQLISRLQALPISSTSSLLGVIRLEIVQANNLKPDGSTFTVVTFAANSFRTKLARKQVSPAWAELLLLTVYESEQQYPIKFGIYEKGKISRPSFLCNTSINVQDLLSYAESDTLVELKLSCKKSENVPSTANPPTLQFKARYISLDQLYRQFWICMATEYLGEVKGKFDQMELWTFLNSMDVSITFEDVAYIFLDSPTDSSKMSMTEILDTVEASPQENLFYNIFLSLISVDSKGDALRAIVSSISETKDDNEFIISRFLTESYAAKGWFSRLANRIGNGKFEIGADSANLLVRDRQTGQLIEEKMVGWIRLGIRTVYRSKIQMVKRKGLDSKLSRAILKNSTVRQGRLFNDPKSARSIRDFIRFHDINVEEILEPLDSFKTFNEFFYRKLKPDARRLASLDPNVVVSPADARMLAFRTIDEATRLWIKGKEFTLESLLQSHRLADVFDQGSLAIFRLAPQDYHRFHAPVGGIIGPLKEIDGTYYTVNPMAIREKEINVFTENKRTVMTINSPIFGEVGYVIIGAMLVGSIVVTSREATSVKRLDEIGYFAFGGSTIICLFRKGVVEFDADLLESSQKQLETLVQVGNSIGRYSAPSEARSNVTSPNLPEQPLSQQQSSRGGQSNIFTRALSPPPSMFSSSSSSFSNSSTFYTKLSPSGSSSGYRKIKEYP